MTFNSQKHIIHFIFLLFSHFIIVGCNNVKENLVYIEKLNENGVLKESYFELNGKIHGEKTLYNKGKKNKILIYENGLYQGVKFEFDSLGRKTAKYTEYFSKEDEQWLLNEEIYFNDFETVDNSKSFYNNIFVNNNCIELSTVTGLYGNNPLNCKLIINTKSFKDTVLKVNNCNYFNYCFPEKFIGEAEIIYEGNFLITDSLELNSYLKVYGKENYTPSISYSIIKKITIKK